MIALAVVSTVAVALGLLDMPYGYYTLLRFLLSIAGAVGFAAARSKGDPRWQWIYGVMVVLYNPVWPVHLGEKGLWVALNVVTLVVLWIGAVKFRAVLRLGKNG